MTTDQRIANMKSDGCLDFDDGFECCSERLLRYGYLTNTDPKERQYYVMAFTRSYCDYQGKEKAP
jgi:hypothetical protein